MTRRHCPQDFDCIKMGATPRRKCPNLEFCKEARLLGGNQKLPYQIQEDDKGNKYLTVRWFYDEEERERFKQLGWAHANSLPYGLFKFENCPVLYVYGEHDAEDFGWARAEELPWEYFQWCAAVLSKSLSEFRELTAQHESKRFDLWHADWFYDVWRIN